MQVSNINNNTIQIKSHGKSSPFKSGAQFKATVTHVNNDGSVVLETDKGLTFTATNTSNFGLNVGDTIALIVTTPSSDGNMAGTVITQINGQPIDQNVSLSELHLIDLGIMPNPRNMRMYNILQRHQLPLTKEYVLNLKNIFAKLPGVTDEQAAFMAANNIEPTEENLKALMNLGTLHKDIAQVLSDSLKQILNEYGLNQKAVNDILSTMNELSNEALNADNIIPNTDNPSATETVQQQTSQTPTAVTNSENNQTFQTGLGVNGKDLIPDKAQLQNDITNYFEGSTHSDVALSEATTKLMPKLTEAVIKNVVNQLADNPSITLETVSDLSLPEQLPPDIQLTMAALPEETNNEIMQVLPEILTSAKEFMALKLFNHVDKQLNIPVNKELDGASLKKLLKNQPSNLNAIATDKGSQAVERTLTSLKMCDSTMCFVQIPVQLNDFKTTAEMYMVKREKNKQLSLENGIKMVFALNTEHLGRIETIISANTIDLNLNIRVQNAKVQEVVQRDMAYLKSLLSTTNFTISNLKVTMIDKPVTALNAHTYFGYKQLDITV